MSKFDFSYWDEESPDYRDSKTKKKKKKKNMEELYGKDDKLPLSKEYLEHMADILDQFYDIVKTYFIYPDLSQEEYNEAKRCMKKAIARMREGKTKDFDYERTMDAIANGDIPEKYIDGGY